MDLALKIKDLIFSWDKADDFVLNLPKWQVEKGEKVFLFGQSGSGKSTVLNLLCGVVTKYKGNIEVLGQDLSQISSAKRDRFRANNIGMIFQQFNLIPYLSGLQNIQLGQYFSGKPNQTQLVHQLSQNLKLTDKLLSQPASKMSVGQQQRIAVARALINQPKIIIADEPTSALDSELRDDFIKLLLDCASESTVIFVSHDRSLAPNFSHQYDLMDLILPTEKR